LFWFLCYISNQSSSEISALCTKFSPNDTHIHLRLLY
jgi:hypothetical protein